MKLNLRNPIIFFDLETTGINVAADRIVELSYLKIDLSGNELSRTIRVNPGVPIPEKASEIHGIKDEDVKDSPTFNEVARTIAQEFEGCDLAGYNSVRFDIPLLAEEFLRAGVDIDLQKKKFVDVQIIFMKMEPRTLSAALKYYCGKELTDAHSAEADTRATYEILQSQLDRYSNLQNDITWLSEFSAHNRNVDFAGRIILDDKDVEVFNFGKYKGRAVADVLAQDPGYYGWMMQGDFPLYTKKVLTSIKLRARDNKS
ncbi:MAG: exonuclease domain-containing protein [Bacteroidales bacterium]|nr:exonuclease domain-containing protein [Bacteroidales bacterium]MDT8431220.1 exonuclease domain-containing protein [Bacteroidales bacterium]